MIEVHNLSTGETLYYTLGHKDAVIAAYRLEKGLPLVGGVGADLPIYESDKTVSCGDWATIKRKRGNINEK